MGQSFSEFSDWVKGRSAKQPREEQKRPDSSAARSGSEKRADPPAREESKREAEPRATAKRTASKKRE